MEKIKELREKTGAGMVDCKKALDEAKGDIKKAIELLRKKGIAKAAKRGERETAEGIILVDANEKNTEGYIVQFSSETDFVARNEKFQAFTKQILDIVKNKKPSSMDELMSIDINGTSVKDTVDNLSGVIGEKLAVAKFEIVNTSGTVAAYSHMGGRIGVLVEIDKADTKDISTDIAMQVAATDPKCINPEEVEESLIQKEKDIYKEQLLKEGKPENIIDKIIEGKINKFYTEICLAKQEFIKDDKKSIEEVLDGSKILKFVRYSL
jgi:elongation factor Ts